MKGDLTRPFVRRPSVSLAMERFIFVDMISSATSKMSVTIKEIYARQKQTRSFLLDILIDSPAGG
jgi:hypothetical protein